ncbi:MAG TPA: ABC transporter substrate-binding protein [Dehalococcoidia bacterium]|nr:ABC transporter substrate-binding protein [Dehalococcoidia bacterium]
MLGCSGNDDEKPANTVGLASEPSNSTFRAQAGGTLKTAFPIDPPSFDPLASASTLTHSLVAAYTYPRLLKFTAAAYPESATGAVEGDLAEAFEFSPDRLSLTLRLRQGLRWENRAPTGNRLIDAQDVVFSWTKFARFSPFRNDLAYHTDQAPGSPIDSVSSPNPQTVVFRLKYVDSAVLGLLAAERPFYVMPRESEGGFDPRLETRGYGPWLMSDNRPGSRFWNRNPDYHVKGRPYFERIEVSTTSEYAARLAHFKAGSIYTSIVSQDDVLPTKRELPDLLLRKADTYSVAPSSIAFGYNELAWRDERLRQAVSLLIDRETLIDLRTNRRAFTDAGLSLDTRYHTAVAAGWEGYWVDPLNEGQFGPNGRYYRFDPAEARKLLSAGGYDGGIETLLHYNGGNEYGPSYNRSAELLAGMLRDGDINASLIPHDFANDWQPNYNLSYAGVANPGKPLPGFPGIAYRSMGSYPTPAMQLFSSLHRAGSRFHGMSLDGKNPHLGDPDLNRMLEEMRREFDIKKQQTFALDIARFVARKAYVIPMLPFAALNYSLSWPVMGNLGVFRGWPGGSAPTETALHHWLDTTKAPLAQKPS